MSPVKKTPRNAWVAFAATGVVAAMVGLSYAAVPLYQLFCKVTGFGGTTQVADAPVAGVVGNRVIRVTFDATVNSALPWRFEPLRRSVDLKVGEQILVHYRATNLSGKSVTGVASFNVTPHKMGAYFDKVECFCFTEQTLKPGETVDMPVVFYLDPELVRDRNLADVTDVVLSYTFFRAGPAVPDGRHASFSTVNRDLRGRE
jgi:cytochrome c oxidase assembly protein subunit 11